MSMLIFEGKNSIKFVNICIILTPLKFFNICNHIFLLLTSLCFLRKSVLISQMQHAVISEDINYTSYKISICLFYRTSIFSALRFFFFLLFRVIAVVYWISQAKGWIWAADPGLYHNHSNSGSKPCLWPTPEVMAMLFPLSEARDQSCILTDTSHQPLLLKFEEFFFNEVDFPIFDA